MSYANDPVDQVAEGMTVYDSDGDKLGEVGEVNIGTYVGETLGQTVAEERSFFQVKRGLFGLGQDLYVPAEAVDSFTKDGIKLKFSKDEADRQGWGTRPETPGQSAGAGDDTLLV